MSEATDAGDAGLTETLLADVDALVAECRGALSSTRRGSVISTEPGGGELECVDLGPGGGEWLELGVGRDRVRLRFCGWTEVLVLDGDAEDQDEACALALDFVAAAMFGELRVVESRLRGEVLRRSLEVAVQGVWRRCAKSGRLGLAGARAWLRRDLERHVRSNEGRVARPRALAKAGPQGLPSAPWAGAAGELRVQESAAELPLDGELDLHNFSPKEVAPLVRAYIEACQERGVHDLRIVHGKGKGVLRRTVHAVLAKHEAVADYRLGGHGEGSWGATIVRLKGAPEAKGEGPSET